MVVSRKTVYSKTTCHLLLSIWINKATGVVWQRKKLKKLTEDLLIIFVKFTWF